MNVRVKVYFPGKDLRIVFWRPQRLFESKVNVVMLMFLRWIPSSVFTRWMPTGWKAVDRHKRTLNALEREQLSRCMHCCSSGILAPLLSSDVAYDPDSMSRQVGVGCGEKKQELASSFVRISVMTLTSK